jgi:hypothetical protein
MGDVAKATNDQLFKHQRSTDFESHVVRRRVFGSWLVKKSAKSCSRETPIELFDRVEITSLFLIAKEPDAFASV